jgi:adenosylcobinamide kinase/adenosylcobinamide-phosphate guanylyltransferase
MKVQLLGTGSADGWPNPFCDCVSCAWARREDEVRGHTGVLVDDVLMLDCGPDVPRSAARLGVPLGGVRWLLLGHAHPDHTGPQALMWRSWSTVADRPLEVVGPPAAIAACRDWVGPQDPVTFREIAVGDTVQLGPYMVTALAAAHGDASIGPAVLYDLRSQDGRLLYATDTGPLPERTLAELNGRFDLVLLEETAGDRPVDPGHHDLAMFAATIAELRRRGCVDERTDVVAVHLGHGNPPEPLLSTRLGAAGARALPDGAVLDVPRTSSTVASPAPGARRVLVTGGARSGKSTFAEQLLAAEPQVDYVATAAPMPDDSEWADRVALHRKRRPAHWTTHETGDLAGLLATDGPPLLIDCLTLWLCREEVDSDPAAVVELTAALRDTRRRVVLVTNEVGSGVVPATASGRAFRDRLGELNRRVATECEQVWLVVSGTPLLLR